MTRILKFKNFFKNIPYLPSLYGIFPVLFLFVHNISELQYEMLWLPLFAVIFVILIFTVVLSIFVQDYRKSGLILSLFFMLFLSYGNFKELLLGGWLEDLGIIRDKYLYSLGILFFGLASYFIMRASDLKTVYGFFKTMGCVLITISLVSMGFSAYSTNKRNNVSSLDGTGQIDLSQKQNFPDIYYIIPDSYGRADTLKELYNYDNGEFINFLKKKGFSVLSDSNSNYQNTILSIPTTLNMDYWDNLLPETIREDDFTNKIQNSRVQQFLGERGYKTIFLNSGYGITSFNKYSHLKFDPSYINDFSTRIIENSLLKYFVIKRQFFGFNLKNEERKRILYNLEKLKEVSEIDGPKFVFSHINVPHSPFLFDRNGGEVDVDWASVTSSEQYNDLWLDQLIFISKQLSSVVEAILAKSKTPPIIIIQSDHGPDMMSLWSDEFSEADMRERIKNFSALYLPNGKDQLLPDNMTNVNTFRFIFKNYFNADYSLLENKIYTYYDYSLIKHRSDLKNIKLVPRN